MHSIIKAFSNFRIRGKDSILENKGPFQTFTLSSVDHERTAGDGTTRKTFKGLPSDHILPALRTATQQQLTQVSEWHDSFCKAASCYERDNKTSNQLFVCTSFSIKGLLKSFFER